ncbi:thioredoxin domain-containing protein [Mucilaginibacter gossypii]|uniref:thioredoxin domain-containing protein n=1 Tax=Mucilaginibacter gossypii TaxID=551996 RepID=UPI000DCE6D0E|nr:MULTISPECIES: thioredoxin domain-containing protein [Mucilaginibacter]QTE39780.1 thioredoxin domain-containing protein [Mucilaginibacter gossypii]RAV54159.1 sulfurtransferase [Mucilaginibacter rubeus]
MKNLKIALLALLVVFTGEVKAQSPALLSLEAFAAKLKQAKEPQILDARSAEEFVQNHIKGAVNIDAKAADYQQKLEGLDKEKPTFVYSIANGRSTVLSRELRTKGFKDVEELPGGLANWIGSGYPIISTTKKSVSLSKAQFDELAASSSLVLVDFGSKYCGACKKLVPVLDSLKANSAFTPKVISIEVYDNTNLAKELKVNVLPTLVLYKNGKEVWKKQGFSSTAQVIANTELAKSGLASNNK